MERVGSFRESATHKMLQEDKGEQVRALLNKVRLEQMNWQNKKYSEYWKFCAKD